MTLLLTELPFWVCLLMKSRQTFQFPFVDEMSTALGESLGDLGKQLEAITEKMKEEDSRVEDDLVSLSSIARKPVF